MSSTLIPSSSFQTVQSVENGIATVRSTNPNSPSNSDLLSDFQNVDSIPKIEINGSFFDESNLPKIYSLSALLKELGELFVRFDTIPKNYNKGDFEHLVKTLSNSLIYLYDNTSTYTGTDSASFIGIANLNTNPFNDAINLNNKFPGIYFAQDIGYYSIFGVEVTNNDLFNSIVLLIPEINQNGVFIRYNSFKYKLNITNSYFRYSSDTKKLVWEITHNLQKHPSVVVTDTAGTTYEGNVTYIDDNKLTITFSVPFKGYADLN